MNIPCHAVSHLCFKLKEFVSSILRHIHGGSKTYPIAIVLCFQHISKEQVLVSGDEMLILYTKNLLYGLACFSLNTSDIKSLDFTVTRFLMKLFKSSKINLINESRYYFNSQLPSELLMKRKHKFVEKFTASQNLLDYFAIQ